jgi:cytochrome c-type biogenesis protein CcmH
MFPRCVGLSLPLALCLVLGAAGCAAPARAEAPPPLAAVPGSASDPAALGLAEPPALPPPAEEVAVAEAERIADGLRCPVCQGLSVADSNADAARAMYARIGELVRLGYSQDQIEDYFVDRYGEWVRLDPPVEGLHWLLWVAPALLAVVGAGVIALRARTPASPSDPQSAAPRHDGSALAGAPASAETPPVDRHRAAILAALEEDGR